MVRFVLKLVDVAGWKCDTIEEIFDKVEDILKDFDENDEPFLGLGLLKR